MTLTAYDSFESAAATKFVKTCKYSLCFVSYCTYSTVHICRYFPSSCKTHHFIKTATEEKLTIQTSGLQSMWKLIVTMENLLQCLCLLCLFGMRLSIISSFLN